MVFCKSCCRYDVEPPVVPTCETCKRDAAQPSVAPPLRVLLNEQDVMAYLKQHGLLQGWAPFDAVLLQMVGTASGQPTVMFTMVINGKPVLAKMSLRLLEGAMAAIRGTVDREAEDLARQSKGSG